MERQDPDWEMMAQALRLARGRAGLTVPNPPVGCVIAGPGGQVIAEGATGTGGRPHAEEVALQQAGAQAAGAVLYVTLEPCTRRSIEAQSCADRIIAAGIRRVVIACAESNPRSAGGAGLLAEAGIEVRTGLRESEGRKLLAGHTRRLRG